MKKTKPRTKKDALTPTEKKELKETLGNYPKPQKTKFNINIRRRGYNIEFTSIDLDELKSNLHEIDKVIGTVGE